MPENIFGGLKKFSYLCTRKSQITCIRSGARVAEEARLESVFLSITSKKYWKGARVAEEADLESL